MHEILFESPDGLTYALRDLLREVQPLEERVQDLTAKPTRTAEETEELRRLRFDILDKSREGFARVVFKLGVDLECLFGEVEDFHASADGANARAARVEDQQAVLVRRVAKLEKSVASMLTKKEGGEK